MCDGWCHKSVNELPKIIEKGTMKLVIVYCEGGAIYCVSAYTKKLCCETIVSKLRTDLLGILLKERLTFQNFQRKIRNYVIQKY
jgi:hypothetical protein